MNAIENKPQTHIRRRLLKQVVFFSLVMSIFFTIIMGLSDYRSRLVTVRNYLNDIEQSHSRELVNALWGFDKPQLAATIDGMLDHDYLNYAAIMDHDRIVVETGTRKQHVISREIQLFNDYNGNKVPVGTLVLQADRRKVVKDVFGRIAEIFLFQLGMVASIAFFIYLIFNRLVTRHLTKAADHFSAFTVDDNREKLSLDRPRRNDELDVLVDSFNDMSDQFSLSYWHLLDTQQELMKSETLHRTLFESANDAIFLAEINNDGSVGLLTAVNNVACERLGYTREELLRMYPKEITVHKSEQHRTDSLNRLQANGHVTIEAFHRAKDGRLIPIEIGTQIFEISGKQVVLGIARDMTERRQAENALRESETRYRRITAAITDYIYSVRFEQGVAVETRHGAGCLAVTGYTENDFAVDPDLWIRMVAEEDRPAVVDQVRHVLAGEEAAPVEHRIVHKDGGLRWIRNTVVPRHDAHGTLISYDGLILDITERKKAEEALKKSTAFLNNILETVGEGLIVIGSDYKILSANKAYLSLVNKPLEKVLGMTCHEIFHHHSRPCAELGEDCPAHHSFHDGQPYSTTHTHYNDAGKPYIVETKTYPLRDDSGRVVSVIEIVNDITERKNLEDQLLQAQKMEAIGQLAGGVAHDFNNILTAIVGYGQLLQMKIADDDPLRIYIDQILQSVDRATHVTHSLLAFSRKQVIKLKPVNLNEVLSHVEKFLKRIIGEDIEFKTHRIDQELAVMADRGHLEQVLMNFATNARDAMPRGGSLTISSGVRELDESFLRAHGYGRLGRYALISISDTGIGMDGKTQEKIFEPFFTTKEMGRGTGLGLSIVYGIIKQHNGFINVYSEPDRGTTFNIFMPLISMNIEDENTVPAPPPRRGTETILMAEDDEKLRRVMEISLKEYGYTVIMAIDGEDAVAKYVAHKDSIQLVILDMIMPKMSGQQVYDVMKTHTPGVKAFFMSGYTADKMYKDGLDEGVQLILKPLSPSDLLHKVREYLDA